MARAFILSSKLSDVSAISASSAVTNAVATNVLLARPRLYWRSTTSTPSLEGDFGLTRTVDTLVVGFANAKLGDTLRLRLATSQANLTASPGYDSTPFAFWPTGGDLSAYSKVHRVFTFTDKSFRWWRVDFGFGSNSDGYAQAGRVMLGKRIEPAVSVGPQWSLGASEGVAETTDLGGEESPRIMGSRRSMTVTWHDLTEAERESLYALILERGSAKDITLAIEPSEGAYSMSRVVIGRIKQVVSFQQTMLVPAGDGESPPVQHFTVSITVSEMAPIEMA